MNLGMVAVLIIAVVILSVTVAALMYYVRHWATRQAQLIKTAQITEGRFVKRYIPPSLRPHYDQMRTVLIRRPLMRPHSVARLMYIVIAGLVLTVVGATVEIHRYKLMAPIDLTQAEINGLRPVSASWSELPDSGLPNMEQRLLQLRSRGVAIVVSPDDEKRVINGQRITLMAEDHWHQFLTHWGIPYQECDWHEIANCIGDKIGIVMPGAWRFDELELLLSGGASIILYGPPMLVLTEHHPLQWQGLAFEPYSNESEPRYLVLRGDQLLTLGFDAGLILDAERAFPGYRVFSDLPQAIGINTDHTTGGEIDTRIYAKRIGKGRLVWMDYAPDELSQADSINVKNLEAIDSAVFRYLLKETYASWATWPEGRRFAGAISEDSEDKFHNAEGVVQMVNAHGFPITWFMLSNEVLQNRSLAQEMANVGEVACHGDSHASFPLGNLLSQTERLARCTKVLKTITGHTPKGFRPPEEKYNDDTINAVASIDMTYYFADDDMDRFVPIIVREDNGSRTLVSLPRMGSDDYEMWHTLKLNDESSLRLADDQLKWISVVGGFLPFSFHTQYMNKKGNLQVVEHYGLRFQQPDCYFATTGQIADWWRVRTRLVHNEPVQEAALTKYRPILLRVDGEGGLTRVRYETVTASKKAGDVKGVALSRDQ